MLEVVRNGKCRPTVLNLRSNKSQFNSYYPKLLPNPDSLIIFLSKKDKILVMAKNSFFHLVFIPLQWKSVTLKCTVGTNFRTRICFKLDCSHEGLDGGGGGSGML